MIDNKPRSTAPQQTAPQQIHKPSRAGLISLVVGLIVLGVKFWGYALTNSQVVLSDALESIVNVIASGVALFALRYAATPPDQKHPYGHGKGEFFSAAFEGGLIVFASVMIIADSTRALILGHELRAIDFGMLIVIVAGTLNLMLALYLLRVGRMAGSASLEASGQHLLSDVWTTGASLVGLLVVRATGVSALDALLGIAAGAYLGIVGAKILRGSIGGLLDENNRDVLSSLAQAFNVVQHPGIIGVHGARIMRAGNYHYIDAHVIVPEFWDVQRSHDEVNAFERKAIEHYRYSGEIHFHIDPCRRDYCRKCILANCPVRQEEFSERIHHSLEEVSAKSSSKE